MAQYRQFGAERSAIRGLDLHNGANGSTGILSDQFSARIPLKQARVRRSTRSDKFRRLFIGAVAAILSLALLFSFVAFSLLSPDKEYKRFNNDQDDDEKNDMDFLSNVTRTKGYKVLQFGHGSIKVGRDSRYWDRDDRRRDFESNGNALEFANAVDVDHSADKDHMLADSRTGSKQFAYGHAREDEKSVGLYNEAGRNELKHYEAEYEASLKGIGLSKGKNGDKNSLLDGIGTRLQGEDDDPIEDYDDDIDSQDSLLEEFGNTRQNDVDLDVKNLEDRNKDSNVIKEVNITDKVIINTFEKDSPLLSQSSDNVQKKAGLGNSENLKNPGSLKKTDPRKGKRRKFSGSSCDMKFLNSTAQLVEPLESKKISRFSLQYTELEDKPNGSEDWTPRFAGHQTLQEREESFYARDQKINCGFIKGPKGSPSTGFDVAEDDRRFMSSCHIAVSSCIFGNSDNLRTPTNKVVTRLSRKNVCFVMFMDEHTLQVLSSEGQKPDNMGYIGFWKIVIVKNLPYTDMRRVGKIPKFLTHRLFPSARYSIWLDSKLRLQNDPLLILEYFLWRRGYEYAISNHYDRHCVWEEVVQNKKLNKFNHTIIDEQFAFYQKDGLKRFNASDPNKPLPSHVPEGSFIMRAHTPMSNLFSCLWFNEVDRFTPRDQLSFAYTYLKLRRMNPEKPFHLNMFKDCERRSIAKLFHHRAEDKRNVPMQALG